MFNFEINFGSVKRLLVCVICIFLAFYWGSSFAQQEKKQSGCLTLQHILSLLEKKVD